MARKKEFSHLDHGSPRMVDVSDKKRTRRTAIAEAYVSVGARIADRLRRQGGLAKGNVLETARIAGIMAARRTAELIPMCHPLALDHVAVEAKLAGSQVHLLATVTCDGKTGVEMEALTAATVAALTVYDMVKSAGKGIEIGPIRLLEKRGGKSGPWVRKGCDCGTS